MIDFESAPDSGGKREREERTIALPDVDVPGILKSIERKTA